MYNQIIDQKKKQQLLSGWGRYPVLACNTIEPINQDILPDLLDHGPLIARGLGRSYGDSSLSKTLTVSMAKFNHFLAFEEATGLLTVEAGVILKDIIDTFLPRGWFVPVTPGTKYVTVGGMIAADVHGKNHHCAKSFGHHVLWLDLMTSDGKIIHCNNINNNILFKATIGGLGLTGIIVRACFKLIKIPSAWLQQEVIATANLQETFSLFEASADWPYSVAWLDSSAKKEKSGRGLIYRAHHATVAELSIKYQSKPFIIPEKNNINIFCDIPVNTINFYTATWLNKINYYKNYNKFYNNLIDYDNYFYPLDRILNWNRLYGKKGLIQFQCFMPILEAFSGITRLLNTVSESNTGCFLAVLKLLADQANPNGMISFPGYGYTLTLDFAVSASILKLIKILQKITIEHHGRFYLVKDACLNSELFYQSDSRINDFYKLRQTFNLNKYFASEQSIRLEL